MNRKVTAILTITVSLLFAGGAASAIAAPSVVDQYTEQVPTAGGEKPVDKTEVGEQGLERIGLRIRRRRDHHRWLEPGRRRRCDHGRRSFYERAGRIQHRQLECVRVWFHQSLVRQFRFHVRVDRARE